MDLTKALLKEHSKAQTTKIVTYIGADKKRFAELVHLFLKGPYRITQRASWPLSICIEHHPFLITPHLTKLLRFAKKPGIHDAAKRNIVRLLQYIDVPARQQGPVYDLCLDFLHRNEEPVAVKVFAMTVLGNIAKHEPDLINELKLIIEDQLPYSSAAFISRARRVLKELERSPRTTVIER